MGMSECHSRPKVGNYCLSFKSATLEDVYIIGVMSQIFALFRDVTLTDSMQIFD